MPAFQPTADQFRAFRDDPYDGPVAQVNLLKFRVKAAYAEGDPEHGEAISGEAAYQRYSEAFSVAAAEVGRTTLLLASTGATGTACWSTISRRGRLSSPR